MKLYKTNHRLSKTILLVTAASLLMNTSCIYPQIGARFREGTKKIAAQLKAKLPGMIKSATSKVKESLSSTFQKVKGLRGEVLINKLLENVDKLGTQIGEIKDCMLFGEGCSPAKRAAFYATAVTILALTAAIVGITITIAATAKEPEVEKALQETSEEAKGWKPAAVFQRLSNKLASFKQSLLSMKSCLIKRSCTRQQKRLLYATAGTITALVSIAIGLGVGSYIYAEHGVELPITTDEIAAQIAEEQIKLAEAQKMQDAAAEQAATVKIQALQKRLDDKIKALAKEVQPVEERPRSKYQEALQKIMAIKETGESYIIEQAAKIKAALTEKTEKAKAALQEKVDEAKKMKLYQEAKAALEKAHEMAHSFIEHIKTLDIVQSLKKILGIDVSTVASAVDNIRSASTKIMEPIEALSHVVLFGQIDNIVAKITKWQNLGEELWANTGELFRQWAARVAGHSKILHPSQIFYKGPTKEEDDRNYPLTAKLNQLLGAYPKLVNLINGLDVATPGRYLNIALREAATTIDSIASLQIGFGPKVIAFIPADMYASLKTLKEQLIALAGLIGSTTQIAKSNGLIRAPIDAQKVASTEASLRQFITASIWNLASPSAFKEKLTSLPTLTTEITTNGNAIKPEVETLQTALDALIREAQEIPGKVKSRFIGIMASKDPVRDVAYAPRILRSILIEELERIKKYIDIVLTSGNAIIEHIGNILKSSSSLLINVNILMGSGDRPYVNEDVINGFNRMSSIISDMVSIVNKLGIDIQQQELPVLIPRAPLIGRHRQ